MDNPNTLDEQFLHDVFIFASATCLVAAGAIALAWAIVIFLRRRDR